MSSDTRFARLKSDPRFRRPKKTKSKVVLDERFHSVLAQEKKAAKSKRVDKYGRPLSRNQNPDDLKRFYRIDSASQQPGEQDPELPDYARGAVLLESSDEEDDNHSAAGSSDIDDYVTVGLRDDEEQPEIDLNEQDLAELDAQASAYQNSHPETGDQESRQTRRLAVVNLDWDHVRALHLFKICSSLVSSVAPPLRSENTGSTSAQVVRGSVLNVRVYPSQFGKERLAREEIEGPPAEIFKKRKSDTQDVDEHNIYELGGDDEHDDDALRKYQLERMRYYYAVVTCDIVEAAAHIYDELEGTELERSANVFDLSFVPEDMIFEDDPRDEATENDLNASFKAVDFVTDALRHSKVKLSWDEDDPERNQVTRRTLNQKEIDEGDFRNLLASASESESDSGEEFKKKKQKGRSRDALRSLLLGKSEDLPEGWAREDDEDDVDMEVTFSAGLSESKEGEGTTIEKYQQKMREKRKKRKEELKTKGVRTADDEFFDPGSDEAEMDHSTSVAVEQSLASDREPNHFNMKSVIKAEKGLRKGKGKDRKKKKREVEETQDDFSIDVTDSRFKALHEDHHFAIDPSNPHFKKTKAMTSFLEERSRRQKESSNETFAQISKDESSKKQNLKGLVDRVKRKSVVTSASNKRQKVG
ncbi:hypothetical protein C8J56DRAFT_1011547 [Mycena floridula]|nr:hypothetical protein C8J56DRAFT_1011547 [Mycena floridula]